MAQSIAFVYAPTGDRVKEEDAALFTDAPPPLGGVVAAVIELEQRVMGTAGIEGFVLRYGMLYGPGTYHDRRGFMAADIIAARCRSSKSPPHVQLAAYRGCRVSGRRLALAGRAGDLHVVDDEPAPQPESLPVLAQALRADPPAAAETLRTPRVRRGGVHRATTGARSEPAVV